MEHFVKAKNKKGQKVHLDLGTPREGEKDVLEEGA